MQHSKESEFRDSGGVAVIYTHEYGLRTPLRSGQRRRQRVLCSRSASRHPSCRRRSAAMQYCRMRCIAIQQAALMIDQPACMILAYIRLLTENSDLCPAPSATYSL